MESQIDKQEYTASAQSRARDGTGGINQPSDVCVNITCCVLSNIPPISSYDTIVMCYTATQSKILNTCRVESGRRSPKSRKK